VGGIGYNQENPGDLFYDNIMMGVQMMEAARRAQIEKFVAVGTVCSYPCSTPLPFREENIWDGYPEPTNAPYGLAKKMLLVMSKAYRQQHGFNSIVIIPTNLYGPGDNFDPRSSHVIPALIQKIDQAKRLGEAKITVWGDGSPTREFLYVEDAAKGLILACESYDKSDPVNIGSGEEVSIRDLVATISRLVGFSGSVEWDTSRPNGQPRRRVDSTKALSEFDFEAEIPLEVGLKRTVDWYESTFSKTGLGHSDRMRVNPSRDRQVSRQSEMNLA